MYNLLFIILVIIISIVVIVRYALQKSNYLQKLYCLVVTALVVFGIVFVLADTYLYFHEGSLFDYNILPHHVEIDSGRGLAGTGFHTTNLQEGYELPPPLDSYLDIKKYNNYIDAIDTNNDTIKLNFFTIVKYGYNATDLMILIKDKEEQSYWLHPVPKPYTIGEFNNIMYENHVVDENSIQTEQYHWITIHQPKWLCLTFRWIWSGSMIILPMLLFSLLVVAPIVNATQKYNTILEKFSYKQHMYIPMLIAAIPLIPMLIIALINPVTDLWLIEMLVISIPIFGCLFFFLIVWSMCLQSLHQILREQDNIAKFMKENALVLRIRLGIWVFSTIIYVFYLLAICYLLLVTGVVKYAIQYKWLSVLLSVLLMILSYVVWQIYLQRQIYKYKQPDK